MATIHITRGTTNLGTFSEEEVREGLRSGRFALTDLAWREGMATWEALSKWPEFGGAASSPPSSATPTVPSVAKATPAASLTPQSGLPWDRRHELGFFKAFIDTMVMVLTKPADAYTVMRREGGLFEPLVFAVVGGSFGAVVWLIFTLLLQSIGFATNRDAMGAFVGMGIGMVFIIIFMPVFIAIGLFIWGAILHLCLMIVGGAKHGFETTFRIICFSCGSASPLIIVPFCGSFIAGIWRIVLDVIGITRAHETDTGRAVLAVFLPLIVCCGGGILLTFLLGGIGALSHWGH
jgi:hypothetical protein